MSAFRPLYSMSAFGPFFMYQSTLSAAAEHLVVKWHECLRTCEHCNLPALFLVISIRVYEKKC